MSSSAVWPSTGEFAASSFSTVSGTCCPWVVITVAGVALELSMVCQ